MSLELKRRRAKSSILSLFFIKEPRWVAYWNGIWNGGFQPALDALNLKLDSVISDDPKRFVVGEWNSVLTYNKDSIVTRTSSASAYLGNASYSVGELVLYVGRTYRAKVNMLDGFDPINNPDKWEDVTTIVYWRSRIDSNTNQVPESNPDKWEIYFFKSRKVVTNQFILNAIKNATSPQITAVDIRTNVYPKGHPLQFTAIDQGDFVKYYGSQQRYFPEQYVNHYFSTVKYSGPLMEGAYTTVAEFNAGTTYALGDMAKVTSGGNVVWFHSLQNSNLNHAPFTSPTWWKQGAYVGDRPKNGGVYIGNPGRRYGSGNYQQRFYMLTFYITDVQGQTDKIAEVIRKYKPMLYGAEIYDVATGTLTVVD